MKGGELQFLKHSKEKAKKLLETGKFSETDLETASYEKNGYCIAVQGRIFFLLFCLLKTSTIMMEKNGEIFETPWFSLESLHCDRWLSESFERHHTTPFPLFEILTVY